MKCMAEIKGKSILVSSSYRGFENLGPYGEDDLFEVEHLCDASHVAVIKLNRQLWVLRVNQPYRCRYYKVQQWLVQPLLLRGGGYLGVKRIGMTVGNPRKLP